MPQRRTPSGQGPARRQPVARSRNATRNTGPIRMPSRRTSGSGSESGAAAKRESGAAAKRTGAPRPRALTGRATVLIAVFVALALAYTYPLRVYLEQDAQIAEMERAKAAQQAKITETASELAKWNDDEYLRIQARDTWFYVRPGETPLLVYYDESGAARDAEKQTPAAAPDRWYDTLWSSVQAANAEPPN
ncbi:septum formation initiator family protein [Actinoplanes sp. NPDC051861]|uniref:FtsB family cell division protein n=1 Tax=Actinoplanes sp. NPDC051861 TaxID=3155170 RepID=UPI00342B88C2